MKIKYFAFPLLVACVFSLPAAAQTCTTPGAFNTPPTGPTVSGDTCGGSDDVAAYCVLQDSSGKPDAIYQLTLTSPYTATQISISGSGTGFTPSIYLYNDACTSADACAATGVQGTPMSLSGVSDGTYFLAVSASQVDGSGACGTYTVTANGTLPVQLQNFSIN